MDLGISEKIAVVTAAGRGLGRAVAKRLALEGVRVVAISRSEDTVASLQAELGKPHRVLCRDLMEPDAGTQIAETVLREIGAADIVIHNMGGSLGVTDPLAGSDEWQRVWRFNLGVPLDMNRVFLPPMRERRWGRIVHVSSSAAITFQGYAAYVSAKAALNGYVRTVGRALAASDVVMSAVMPGPIRVPGRYLEKLEREGGAAWAEYVRNHLPIGRLAADDEIAASLLFYCSKHASYSAAALLPVDGGVM
jgi:3-oxoacyl-[acyl-carrier protein] reductase